jgi:hypothetical protein
MMEAMEPVTLVIEGFDLPGRACPGGPDFPGYGNVHVGVQRKDKPGELLDVQPGDAPAVSWRLPCEAIEEDGVLTLRGRYIQNRLGGRFVYLSWVDVDADGVPRMFRRAKLLLSRVTPEVMAAAVDGGVLVARVRMTDQKGNPACAGMQGPNLVWSAGSAG